MSSQELVVKRKIGGRSGKKKWRRQSDTRNLQAQDLKELKETFHQQARKKANGPAFKIQVEPDQGAKKKLDKDRFKSKDYELTSRAEIKKLKQLEKHVQPSRTTSAPQQAPAPQTDLEAQYDLWDLQTKIHHPKPQVHTNREIEVPKIIKPHAGQSYNPAFENQIELMEKLVDRAEEKQPAFKTKSQKAQEKGRLESLRKRPPVFTSKKEKDIWLAQQKEKDEKRHQKEMENVEAIVNIERKKTKKLETQLRLKREKRANITEQMRKGEIMPTQRKIGHRKYIERLPEFKELETDTPAVKNIEASNEPLKDVYDGIFRKGYLEPYSTSAGKSSRMPRKKFHTDHNMGWEATGEERKPEDGLGVFD